MQRSTLEKTCRFPCEEIVSESPDHRVRPSRFEGELHLIFMGRHCASLLKVACDI